MLSFWITVFKISECLSRYTHPPVQLEFPQSGLLNGLNCADQRAVEALTLDELAYIARYSLYLIYSSSLYLAEFGI